ncbi:uncharacterized protein [Ptychodera flava]|uniref:uncharacterized protein n=1 Tax=Ptychodera flava TaxID=63121 RepID=UPI00396A2342
MQLMLSTLIQLKTFAESYDKNNRDFKETIDLVAKLEHSIESLQTRIRVVEDDVAKETKRAIQRSTSANFESMHRKLEKADKTARDLGNKIDVLEIKATTSEAWSLS